MSCAESCVAMFGTWGVGGSAIRAPPESKYGTWSNYYRVYGFNVHYWKLTWKPKRGPIKTTVPLKWGYMGFHVSLESVEGFRVVFWFPGFNV